MFYELRIYPGADGEFTIYKDEGDNYNYEKGPFAHIDVKLKDDPKSLILEKRRGNSKGIVKKRVENSFGICWSWDWTTGNF